MATLYIKKVELDSLFKKLMDVYEEGADYIDIEITTVEEDEVDMKIIVKSEYMSDYNFEEDNDLDFEDLG